MNDSFTHIIMGMDCTVHYNVIAETERQQEFEPEHPCEVELDYVETDHGFDLELDGYYVMGEVFTQSEGTVRKPVPLIDELTDLAGEDAYGKGR